MNWFTELEDARMKVEGNRIDHNVGRPHSSTFDLPTEEFIPLHQKILIIIMIHYHNKYFRPVQNTQNGETSPETIFHYTQEGNIISSVYQGGKIIKGHLIGIVDDEGKIDMRYHQVNDQNEIMTGICHSLSGKDFQ